MCVRDGTEKCYDPENFEPCGWCILIAHCPQARKAKKKSGQK